MTPGQAKRLAEAMARYGRGTPEVFDVLARIEAEEKADAKKDDYDRRLRNLEEKIFGSDA